ncbi:MAG TPA: hypothetical protein VNW71_06010 [Thermoanaerobaculia bacterium]|nr:hypothetical protein [Thermoanaerobaculia bacterium]
MNADFLVLKIHDEVASLNELKDGEARTLGTRTEVRRQIEQALPSVRWQEEGLGVWWSGEVFSVEIGLPDEEPVHSLTLKVRMHPMLGANAWLPDEEEELESFLVALCDPAGWTLFDLASGRRFEFGDELEDDEIEPSTWHEAGLVN